jgi:hypothetical protein
LTGLSVGVGEGGDGRVGVGVGEWVGVGEKVLDGEGEAVMTRVAIGTMLGETAQLANNIMKIAAYND